MIQVCNRKTAAAPAGARKSPGVVMAKTGNNSGHSRSCFSSIGDQAAFLVEAADFFTLGFL